MFACCWTYTKVYIQAFSLIIIDLSLLLSVALIHLF